MRALNPDCSLECRARRGLPLQLVRGLLLLTVLGAGLAACKSPMPAPVDSEAELKRIADRGYSADQRYATRTLRETWPHGAATLDVDLVAPAGAGPYPLVLYFPALGEPASAGALWRTAWAQAGYAVLSVQPSDLGPAVLASPKARSGDFRSLALEHYSGGALKARVDDAAFVLTELQRRMNSPASPYAVIDIRRVAVAGFDLGAQTAAALVGEKAETFPPPDAAIRAAILLSPYVDVSAAGGLSRRFAAVRSPVLSITGTADDDPFGLVTSPGVRRAAWESMPPGDKYLLVLYGGSHGMLAGDGFSGPGERAQAQEAASDGKGSPRTGGRRGRRGGGGGGGGSGVGGLSLDGLQAADGKESGATSNDGAPRTRGAGGRGNAIARSFDLRHIAAVRATTTAFLDAVLKDDPIAREWLSKDASRWIGESGSLQAK